MPNILIVGASRGIGQQFVKHYLASGAAVSATARSDDALSALTGLGANPIRLDVLDAAVAGTLESAIAAESIDIAIINSGVFGPRADAPAAPTTDDFDHVMRTNVLGPMRLLGPMGSRIKAGGKLAILSSRMGSISMRTQAGGWLYRASKAAVNSVAKDAAITLQARGISVVSFHPGWVRTDMGGANADIDVTESVAGMVQVLAKLSPENSGRFINYDGTEFTW
jgi:NAD(P)-dependent dehydrogenase (short-subunit alcohol dehydrogenase family)